MKARIIILLAFAALAGFAVPAQAHDHGFRCGSHYGGSHYYGRSCYSYGLSVPLFYYTGAGYNSSIYGSPGYSPYGYYYGSRPYSYYRYQANPYYANTTYVRYAAADGYSSSAAVQVALARRGYYHGAIDGVIGPMSRNAIQRYQASCGMAPTGAITYSLLRSLGIQ